nr:DUF1178 family protein [Desulfobulbaceae bacterium]
MIVYDLTCICGYQFEAWFRGRADYDSQCQNGLLVCPECAGNDIHKILSPVSTVTHITPVINKTSEIVDAVPETVPSKKELEAFIETVSTYVKENYQDVGSNLAEKALKMHYGVEEHKRIRGCVSAQEEKMLADEGIELIKIPLPLDDTDQKN